jgi:signal transduction histidine kinase
MRTAVKDPRLAGPDLPRLLTYVADLELEVDRLRQHNRLIYQAAQAALDQIQQLCEDATGDGDAAPALAEVGETVKQLAGVLHDMRELPGYHPAYDQVIAIAVRPLAEQVFRWQQRLLGATDVALHLELETEYMEWFPARLRHILDNLISNALRYRDPDKTEAWVRLGLRPSAQGYELRLSDNGSGLPPAAGGQVFELFYRAAPVRAAGLGVGLAVVKMLVEQSGGSLTVDSGAGQGTTFVALLPRYELDDFLI